MKNNKALAIALSAV